MRSKPTYAVRRRAGQWPRTVLRLQRTGRYQGGGTYTWVKCVDNYIGIRILRHRKPHGRLSNVVKWPLARARFVAREIARQRSLKRWRCEFCGYAAMPHERQGELCLICHQIDNCPAESCDGTCGECGSPLVHMCQELDICPTCDRWAASMSDVGETADSLNEALSEEGGDMSEDNSGSGEGPGGVPAFGRDANGADTLSDTALYLGTGYDMVISGATRAIEALIELHRAHEISIHRLYNRSVTTAEQRYYCDALIRQRGFLDGLRAAGLIIRQIELPE